MMRDVRAIQVTCPQCGAALRVTGASDQVTCEYCGTLATVQRRSQILQRVLPPPSLSSDTPFAIERRSTAGPLVGVMIVMLAAAGGLVFFVARHASSGATSGTSGDSDQKWVWEGGGAPIIRGDQVIGRRRSYTPDQIDVAGMDAATGEVRWHTAPLGTYDETYQGTLVLAGDTLVFASDRGKVTALDPANGTVRWAAALPERPRHYCLAAKDVLAIVTADDVRRPMRLANGQPTDDAAGAPCTRVAQDRKDVQWDEQDAPNELQEAAGEWVGKLVTGDDGARAMSGRRAKGTNVPVIAGLDGDKVTWTAVVPPDPMAAAQGGTNVAGVGHGVACATYGLEGSNQAPHITCFATTDGTRRWDAAMTGDAPLEALSVSARSVLVSAWGVLEAHDPKTGALQWKLGEAF
jgi:outer membrane protein assembly factor BamB